MNEGSFGLFLTITLILTESEILTGINFFFRILAQVEHRD